MHLGGFITDAIKGLYGMYKLARNIFTGNEDENLGFTNKESWTSFIKNLKKLGLKNISLYKYGKTVTLTKR